MRRIIAACCQGLLFTYWTTFSAHAHFTTIINVPADVAPSSIGAHTQLNLFDGGTVSDFFVAGVPNQPTGTEVNIFGGIMGDSFKASSSRVNIYGGVVGNDLITIVSMVNISNGTVGDNFDFIGGTLNLSGGTIGNNFDQLAGGINISGGTIGDNYGTSRDVSTNIFGSEMRLDGTLITGLEAEGDSIHFEIPEGSVFSGTLADGTPFALTSFDGDSISPRNFQLHATELPEIGPAIIYASAGQVPLGVRQGQTINVGINGTIGDHFNAGAGSTVNVTAGGRIGRNLEVVGSNVNLAGGSIGNDFDAYQSVVNFTGGAMGDGSSVVNGSTMNISGGDMRLNGVPIAGLDIVGDSRQIDLPDDFVLSGTLADGTPFAFSSYDGDYFASDTLTLHSAALPSIGPAIITATVDPIPLGIRQGQTITIGGGAMVSDQFSAGRGSSVNVLLGGVVGHNLEAVGSTVNISGGEIGDDLDAFDGSEVSVSGGMVGGSFHASDSSTINISGGTVGDDFNALNNSVVNISGGTVGDNFLVSNESTINISSGSVGNYFNAFNASAVNITGGTVCDNFSAFNGTTVSITNGEIGNKFFFNNNSVVNISGGVVGNELFVFDGSTLNITGGFVGDKANVSDNSVANISGGVVGDQLTVTGGGTVNITGGTVGNELDAFGGSMTTLAAGAVGHDFDALDGSIVNITGGTMGFGFEAHDGSTINISGGAVAAGFTAHAGSTIHLFGTEFLLGGVDISDFLLLGQSVTISNRDSTLSGLFNDGSRFSFDLNGDANFGEDYFDVDAILTVTLLQPGDFDFNGHVDGFDFLEWQRGFGARYDSTDLANWRASFDNDSSSDSVRSASNVLEFPSITLLALLFLSLASQRTTIINRVFLDADRKPE